MNTTLLIFISGYMEAALGALFGIIIYKKYKERKKRKENKAMDKPLGWTTVEQSKKLLAAGLNPDTADMLYKYDHNEHKLDAIPQVIIVHNWDDVDNKNLPCWSLGVLMDIAHKAFADSPKGFDLYSAYHSDKNANATIQNVSGHSLATWQGWTCPIDMFVEIVFHCIENGYIKRKGDDNG